MEDRIRVYKGHGVNVLVADILNSFTMSMRDGQKVHQLRAAERYVIASFLESIMMVLQENRGNTDLTIERLLKTFDAYTEKFVRRVA